MTSKMNMIQYDELGIGYEVQKLTKSLEWVLFEAI